MNDKAEIVWYICCTIIAAILLIGGGFLLATVVPSYYAKQALHNERLEMIDECCPEKECCDRLLQQIDEALQTEREE